MNDQRASIRVELADRVHTGRVVDLRATGIGPESVADAIATEGNEKGAEEPGALSVDCPAPRPVHEHVGVVRPDISVDVRVALAAAARSRGVSTPQDREIADLRETLAELSLPDGDADGPDPAAARRRLAGTESEVDRLRERVATLRGRIQAARDAERETGELETELGEVAAALSEAETERAAAREALDRAERRAREDRDARERRRQLQDRLGNLERDARARLADAVREEYATAVSDLCGDAADPTTVDDVSVALSIARVADLRAPVVLACDRFADPTDATGWLGAPVIRVAAPEV